MKKDVCIFVEKCDVCQHNKGETIKSPGTLQPLSIPPSIWRDIYIWILLWDYLNQAISQSSWWSWIVFPSMCIYVLFNTHLLHPLWLKFPWIIYSRFMACLILLFMIAIPLSPTIFDKNCSNYRAPNCISTPPIIPRLIVKLKSSTIVWRLI
jgi:hypothetical protein